MQKQKHYDSFSYTIHWVFAVAIVFQLFSSQWMHHNAKHNVPQWSLKLFLSHEVVGVSVFIALLIYLYRALTVVEKNKIGHLFPFSKTGLRQISIDIILLLRIKIPSRDFGGLAGFIQGLGVILCFTVAVLGLTWLILPYFYTNSYLIYYIKKSHEFLAEIIWYYSAGHVTMFFMHLLFDKHND